MERPSTATLSAVKQSFMYHVIGFVGISSGSERQLHAVHAYAEGHYAKAAVSSIGGVAIALTGLGAHGAGIEEYAAIKNTIEANDYPETDAIS